MQPERASQEQGRAQQAFREPAAAEPREWGWPASQPEREMRALRGPPPVRRASQEQRRALQGPPERRASRREPEPEAVPPERRQGPVSA